MKQLNEEINNRNKNYLFLKLPSRNFEIHQVLPDPLEDVLCS